jgi:hypothetical protein
MAISDLGSAVFTAPLFQSGALPQHLGTAIGLDATLTT